MSDDYNEEIDRLFDAEPVLAIATARSVFGAGYIEGRLAAEKEYRKELRAALNRVEQPVADVEGAR